MIDKSMRQYQKRVGLRYGMSPGEAQARGTGASSHGQSAASPSRDGGGGGPPNRNFVSSPPPTQVRVEPPEPRVSPIQSMAMVGNTSLAGKTQDEAQASVDRDNKLEQMKNIMKAGVVYRKPILFPTKKKPTVYETSGTGPFKKDGRDYQDRIQQTKRKIEFDPNLSNKEKVERNKILDDFVYKGTFAAEPKINYGDVAKKGIFNFGLKKAGLGYANPLLGLLSLFRGKKPSEISKSPVYDLATDLLFNQNKGTRTGTINNRSNVQDTRDGIRSNIVAGGGDVVSQKVKEFTGEPTVEKPVEQKTDPRRLQALKLLRQLQEYDSQNRLNEKGKQALAQLTSFTNKPITGRSRDI